MPLLSPKRIAKWWLFWNRFPEHFQHIVLSQIHSFSWTRDAHANKVFLKCFKPSVYTFQSKWNRIINRKNVGWVLILSIGNWLEGEKWPLHTNLLKQHLNIYLVIEIRFYIIMWSNWTPTDTTEYSFSNSFRGRSSFKMTTKEDNRIHCNSLFGNSSPNIHANDHRGVNMFVPALKFGI